MKFVRLALVPLALLLVGIVRLLAKVGILIRFGDIWSARIGHMAGNMECYLCEKDAGMQRGFDIFTHHRQICNRQLAKMLSRCVWIDPTRFVVLLILVNRLFAGWDKHMVSPSQLDRDIHNLQDKYPPHLEFTEAEEKRGQAELRRMGIPKGAKWVCLIVRDSAYLPQLKYHGYRDSDVDSYWLAAMGLASRGYYVFRMGAKVAKAFAKAFPVEPYHDPRIIDYATNGMRSEFMDVYLGAKCAFAVSNGTGIDAIPVVFRRPVCYVNYAPIEYLCTFNRNSLAIFKHYEKDGKRMTLEEVYKSGAGQFMSSAQFTEAGITLVDNTPEEIREVVLEMAAGVRGDSEMQKRFWSKFPKSISPYNGLPLHGQIRMRIGSKFLEQYDQR